MLPQHARVVKVRCGQFTSGTVKGERRTMLRGTGQRPRPAELHAFWGPTAEIALDRQVSLRVQQHGTVGTGINARQALGAQVIVDLDDAIEGVACDGKCGACPDAGLFRTLRAHSNRASVLLAAAFDTRSGPALDEGVLVSCRARQFTAAATRADALIYHQYRAPRSGVRPACCRPCRSRPRSHVQRQSDATPAWRCKPGCTWHA